jgi:hypothetical protein
VKPQAAVFTGVRDCHRKAESRLRERSA